MRVAHVGPPLARTGGPAGVLLQLKAAFDQTGTRGHTISLPPMAGDRAHVSTVGPMGHVRAMARRMKRGLFGAPRFYRPPLAELRQRHGRVERLMHESTSDTLAKAGASLAASRDADLMIAHEVPHAERLLDMRRPGQQVWMFVHVPMPVGLYFAWNWAVPEQDWREIVEWPDMRAWIDRELDIWKAVDRVVMATPDALEEVVRVDERFRTAGRMEYTLTGASAPGAASSRSRAEVRKAWRLPLDQPVGLFLGNTLPYRGFDRLMAGLDRLVDPHAIPGIIAVAGPEPATLPPHERIRALGPVQDVGELMGAVDFFVNVNRFNMFDLSLIEAAQSRLPLLLHMTGGNRTFASLGAGHVPIADLGDAAVARGIEAMFVMSRAERDALGAQSRACYDAYLTLAHTARRHLALYDTAPRAAVPV